MAHSIEFLGRGLLLATMLLPLALTLNAGALAESEREAQAEAKARTILAVQEGYDKVTLFSPSSLSGKISVPVHEKPHEIELTPDGKTAFITNFGLLEVNHKVGTPGTTVSVIDVRGASVRTEFHLPSGYAAPHGIKLRPPHYEELFTNAEAGSEAMVVFDAATGTVLRTFPLPHGVHNFVFSPDGTGLYAFTTTNSVLRIHPETGAILATATIPSPRGIAWTADAKRLIVGGKSELLFLDPSTLEIESRWGNLGVKQIFYPAASLDGRWIFAPAVLDGTVLVLDAATGAVAHRVETGSPLAVIQDGTQLWISNVLVPPAMLPPDAPKRRGGIVLLDLTTFKTTAVPDLEDTNGLAISKVSSSTQK